ncbi:MAG TPA: CPBP family intramembrane glutamic endopeptidase, partial [Ilumatobacteraceae bacterium]|nr:CPBP family intramembrane glutamic endopeptidase [Ilumatobacteraceae bacterium]
TRQPRPWRQGWSVGRPPRSVRVPEILVPSSAPATVDEPGIRRRRRVVATATIVVGTALLGATLRVPRGSAWFTVLGVLVAATWTVGSFASGPIPLTRGRVAWRSVVGPVLTGVAAFVAFVVAYLVARRLPLIGPAIDGVLTTADAGPTALVLFVALVNGVGEELFFRGALHAALERHHPATGTTIAYVVVTAATGNIALVIAAVVMGVLFSLERLSTRAVLAPMVTHLTWSTLMILALPR